MTTLLVSRIAAIVMFGTLLLAGCQIGSNARSVVAPEQKKLVYRNPESLPRATLPTFSKPRTVSHLTSNEEELRLSLDEAIRISLDNADVIRVLAGVTATSSGRTVYDPAIANTAIDNARGRFDPTLSVNNTFSLNETPVGAFTGGPPGAQIIGTENDSYILDGSISKINPHGGTSTFRFGTTRRDIDQGLLPLNPQINDFTEFSYVHPLLQGSGTGPNLAPVLIAGIDTERSFFQFKDSVQRMTRGVIEAYWNLVFARTDRWAREQQVAQSKFLVERQEARLKRGFAHIADVAQAKVSYANFRANLISAKSNVLQREAALLNIMGLSPTEVGEVIPTTPPHQKQVQFDWDELIGLAETYRPDLIELKLVLEADRQRVISAQNNALPRLDAVALYRWDGLQGRTPSGGNISSNTGEFADWSLGVNFSVPLGLRQARSTVRQQELIVRRDLANLDQGLHSAVHQLALVVRNLDQYYEQHAAFTETRIAARDNLARQLKTSDQGLLEYLNVLQAITSWGNAVSAQAQSLSQYNTELATIELQTGTILESHGIRFVQERKRFLSPIGFNREQCYPSAILPTENNMKYPDTGEPAENSFNLESPLDPKDEIILPEPESKLEPEPEPELGPDLNPIDIEIPEPPQKTQKQLLNGAINSTLGNLSLLVPQSVDRIQSAGLPSGIKTEKDTDTSSK